MKKLVSILILCVVLCAGVFASTTSTVSAAVDPYSVKFFTMKEDGERETLISKYAVGGSLRYDWNVWKGLSVGAEVNSSSYFMKDTTNFTDISFLGKIGYTCDAYSPFKVFAALKGGIDLQIYDHEASPVGEFAAEVGAKYQINDQFDVFVSIDNTFGFTKRDDARVFEYRLTPYLGAGFTF